MKLSKDQINQFYETGYLFLDRLFLEPEIAEIRTAIERLQVEASSLEGIVMHKGSQFVVTGKQIRRVVWCGAAEPILLKYGQDERLISIAKQVLGSKKLYQLINQVHFKLPNDGVSYPFHQDSRHRGYGTDEWTDINGKGSYIQTVTAIDESNLENGPLLVMPGSCKKGHLGLPYSENEQTDSELFNKKDAIPISMKPGDVVAFSPYTIHGSLPNNSNKPRRIFINGFAYPGANKRSYPGCNKGVLIE